jgi:hypothetical protein
VTQLTQCLRDELVSRNDAATTIRSHVQIVEVFRPYFVMDFTHALMMSIGRGNTTVVFFSAPISVSVCR